MQYHVGQHLLVHPSYFQKVRAQLVCIWDGRVGSMPCLAIPSCLFDVNWIRILAPSSKIYNITLISTYWFILPTPKWSEHSYYVYETGKAVTYLVLPLLDASLLSIPPHLLLSAGCTQNNSTSSYLEITTQQIYLYCVDIIYWQLSSLLDIAVWGLWRSEATTLVDSQPLLSECSTKISPHPHT